MPMYIKLDGIDGESKNAAPDLDLSADIEPQAVALLLPAVQKVREAASRSKDGETKTFSFGDEDGSTVEETATHDTGADMDQVLLFDEADSYAVMDFVFGDGVDG